MNVSAPLPEPPPTRHAPLALWRVAEAFLRTLHTLFGAPEDIAAGFSLPPAPYKLLLSWIRCAEAMMRRLLLIEAAAVPKPNTRARLRAPSKRAPKLMSFYADKPEDWRVSFRCLAVAARRLPARKPAFQHAQTFDDRITEYWLDDAGPRKPTRFHSPWPLAERYEALIRVFNNPEAYAQRLARTLRALPHRIRELFRAPKEAQHRIEDWTVFDVSAERAWPIADSS